MVKAMSHRTTLLLLLALQALPLLACCAAAPPPDPKALASTDLARGTTSAITEQRLVLVRDEAQWAELWREHGSIRIPSPPAPEVDWSTRQVVALVLGQRSSGGYAVTIEEIRPVEGGWQVIAREDRPAPDAATTMALTSPYHFVVLEEKLDPDLGLELVLR